MAQTDSACNPGIKCLGTLDRGMLVLGETVFILHPIASLFKVLANLRHLQKGRDASRTGSLGSISFP